MGKEAFDRQREILRGKLNINLKKGIVKCLIWSVALYGAEAWTLLKKDEETRGVRNVGLEKETKDQLNRTQVKHGFNEYGA